MARLDAILSAHLALEELFVLPLLGDAEAIPADVHRTTPELPGP
jgi:hypothetical protein